MCLDLRRDIYLEPGYDTFLNYMQNTVTIHSFVFPNSASSGARSDLGSSGWDASKCWEGDSVGLYKCQIK